MDKERDTEKIAEEIVRIVISVGSDFLPGYSFHFSSVGFDEAIHLSYFVTPPISENVEGKRGDFFISADAYDDIGNQYTFTGGAHGTSLSAPCTNGELSFSPLPKDGAERISFTVTVLKGQMEVREEFAVPLEGYWEVALS